jgi:hypothetical protein
MAGYGMKGHVMFAFQESFNTSNVASLQALAITEESVTLTKEQVIEQGMYARFAESPYYNGATTVEGDVTIEASPSALDYFFKAALRTNVTTVADVTSVVTHEYKTTTADFDELCAGDPLTLEIHRDVGSAAVYYNLCGNTFTLNVANGELLTATLGVLGGEMTRQAASSPTFPDAFPFKWDQSSITIDGASVKDIQDMTITLNNNLENRWTLQQSATPYKVKRTSWQTIEIAGTFIFQAHSYWNAYLTQGYHSLICNWASTQTPNALKMDFPRIKFKSFEPNMSGPGIVEAPFTAQGLFLPSSNTAIHVTMTNTVAPLYGDPT